MCVWVACGASKRNALALCALQQSSMVSSMPMRGPQGPLVSWALMRHSPRSSTACMQVHTSTACENKYMPSHHNCPQTLVIEIKKENEEIKSNLALMPEDACSFLAGKDVLSSTVCKYYKGVEWQYTLFVFPRLYTINQMPSFLKVHDLSVKESKDFQHYKHGCSSYTCLIWHCYSHLRQASRQGNVCILITFHRHNPSLGLRTKELWDDRKLEKWKNLSFKKTAIAKWAVN